MEKGKIIFLIVAAISIVYLLFSITKAAYESNIDGSIDSKVAKWNIKVNNADITDTKITEVNVGSVNWNNAHTKAGKVSPGSTGSIDLEIDPTDTDVAIKYEIEYEDSSNSDRILTITSLTSTTTLTKTDDNKYRGYITLDEIKRGIKPVVTINIEWENDEEMNERDSGEVDNNLIELIMTATQYMGEDES